jgi:hypothetical protein
MEIMLGILYYRVVENSRELRVHEVATKSKAVKFRQSCYSPADGMKSTASYPRNKISLISYKALGLSEIERTRFFVV